jgi:hypothetical protein
MMDVPDRGSSHEKATSESFVGSFICICYGGSGKERKMFCLIITLSVDSDILAVRVWLLFLSYKQVIYVFMNTQSFISCCYVSST